MTTASFPLLSFAAVRERLLSREETALLDVREEDPFAQEHPLWAANLPLSRIDVDALPAESRLPTPDLGRAAPSDRGPARRRRSLRIPILVQKLAAHRHGRVGVRR